MRRTRVNNRGGASKPRNKAILQMGPSRCSVGCHPTNAQYVLGSACERSVDYECSNTVVTCFTAGAERGFYLVLISAPDVRYCASGRQPS